MINHLAGLHPKVILFDVMLDQPGTDVTNPQLQNAIANAGNVVLVCTADDRPLPMFANAAAAVAARELGGPDPANAVRGLQLKGKSAERFRVLKVRAMREGKTKPWVQFPTEVAAAAYSTARQKCARQSVFAVEHPDET